VHHGSSVLRQVQKLAPLAATWLARSPARNGGGSARQPWRFADASALSDVRSEVLKHQEIRKRCHTALSFISLTEGFE
jgi:hypothetical protein